MKQKELPHSVDLEETVLGASLIDGNAPGEMIQVLRKEKVFYKPQHQAVYDAILEMYEQNEPIDLLTVSNTLKSKNKLAAVGGEHYLIQLTNKVSSGAHVEYHCRIIQQQFVKRKSIQLAENMRKAAYDVDKDIFDLLESSYRNLDKVSDWLFQKKTSDFKSCVDEVFKAAENKEPGVPSSLAKLQSKLNGYQKSNLIILAARPGMGKTAMVINEALKIAKTGIPVGIFSLEMSKRELTARMIANELEIPSERVSQNNIEDFQLRLMNQKREWFDQLPIHINDQPGISPLEVKIESQKWKREHGVQIIFLDYLQLMRCKEKKWNREQEVSEISRSLKGIAKELDIPVVALAQLSRAVENRGGMRRPLLSDLRESGSIEQDADIVMFLYRPEYYKIHEWDDDTHSSTKNQAEIIISKYRNGRIGSCLVGCKLQYMQFHDLEEEFDYRAIKPNGIEVFEKATQDDDLPF